VLFPLAQSSQDTGFRGVVDNLARTPLSEVLIFVAICTVVRLALWPYLTKVEPHRRTGLYSVALFVNEILDAIVYAGVFVFMIIRPFAIQAFLIPTGSMVPTLLVNDFIVANKAIYRYSDPKVGDIVVFKPPFEALYPDQYDLRTREPKVDFIKRCIGVAGETIEIRDGDLYRNGQKDPDVWLHFNSTLNNRDYTAIPRDQMQMPNLKFVKYEGPYEPWKGQTIPVSYIVPDFPNYEGTMLARKFLVGLVQPGDVNEPTIMNFKPPSGLSSEEVERMNYLRDAKPAPIPPGYYLMVGDNRNNSFDGRAWGLVPREAIVGRSEVIWLPVNRWRQTR
jgi:signal peptidase I